MFEMSKKLNTLYLLDAFSQSHEETTKGALQQEHLTRFKGGKTITSAFVFFPVFTNNIFPNAYHLKWNIAFYGQICS